MFLPMRLSSFQLLLFHIDRRRKVRGLVVDFIKQEMGKDTEVRGRGKKNTEVMEGGRSQNAGLVIIITIRQVFQSLQREVSLQPLH